MLRIARDKFGEVFPKLLKAWPQEGCRTEEQQAIVQKLVGPPCDQPNAVVVNPEIRRSQFYKVGMGKLASVMYSPYTYYNVYHDAPRPYDLLKIRPGVDISVTINRVDTKLHISTVRRINHFGDPKHLLINGTLDVSRLPIRLESETACSCAYCGARPVSDETSCQKCGAPLPRC